MFLESNGARPGLAKILILLTDGSQTASPDAEDPAAIAAELRNAGINLIVVGMGAGVNPAELAKIAGGNDKVFTAATFSDLLSADFMKTVQEKACAASQNTPPPTKPPVKKCKAKVDLGFVLDSSGSIANDYQNEKDFLKSVTAIFGVSKDESRAGVVTFCHSVEHSIKLKDHTDSASFNAAVDAIPLMGSVTRIDKALRLTQNELFTMENGARA